MENTYSVTVTNKFSLALDEDEDPLEVLKVREQEKEAKKKEKLSGKENKSKQPDTQKTAGTKPPKARVIKDQQQQQQPPSKNQDVKKEPVEKKQSQPRVGAGDRNVKFSGESREERNNRRNREDGERPARPQGDRRGPPGEIRETREFRNSNDNQQRGDYGERRGRGGMRGMSRGRGGPRGGRGGFDSRGKREFDRQSGSDRTGIKPVDKKDGAGSHNWGTHNDEIEESMNQENRDWANEKSDAEAAQVPVEGKEGDVPAETTEEKPAEEESRELTLDEWKALRQNRAKPQYNLRKAGEGEDLARWKKMYPLEKKKEGDNEDDEDEEEYDAAVEYPQRVGRLKRVEGIEFQFSDSRRSTGRGRGRGRGSGRGGFGNRGGGGGGGGGSGGAGGGGHRDGERPPPQAEQRSPRSRQNAPKVDDEHDFPSLG